MQIIPGPLMESKRHRASTVPVSPQKGQARRLRPVLRCQVPCPLCAALILAVIPMPLPTRLHHDDGCPGTTSRQGEVCWEERCCPPRASLMTEGNLSEKHPLTSLNSLKAHWVTWTNSRRESAGVPRINQIYPSQRKSRFC